MPVAELLLSPVINVLVKKLVSPELWKAARQEGIHTRIKKWSRTLVKIQAVVADAEERQITEKPVRLWLEDLQDLAFDLDNILDELATEALRRKLAAEPQASTTRQVRKLIPACCSNFTPKSLMFSYKMMSKLEEITDRLHEITNHKNDLNLRETTAQGEMNKKKEIPQTTCLVDEASICGRRKDKEKVVKLLTGDDGCNAQVGVVPIVGMGGVGKTTLAQLVYNDEEVSRCFDVKAWVCVSEEFDVFMISNIIYQSVASDHRHFDDLNSLQVTLQEKLSGRKFLIVLDDVWNENYNKWDSLRSPFRAGAGGSKIIVTTRNKGVASTIGSFPAYHLHKLTPNDCLSLLAQHALGTENFDAHPNLRIIGDRLAEKCDGLPLAAKTLGGLLRTKTIQAEWEEILHSKIWEIPDEKNDILPALWLSYHYLPSHLKQLFAYCSIFSKGSEFDKEELLLLWMAEGFLSNTAGEKRMEELGCQYFDELSSRSFFHRLSADKSGFVMHDLLNDLAQFVASAMCFRMDDKEELAEHFNLIEKVLHISFIREECDVFKRFEDFLRARKLRTFLPLPMHKSKTWQNFYLSSRVIQDVVPKLQCLRVLSLSGYSITELPNSVGDLKHLRYLNLSKTLIRQLPESVSDLYNLQTLLLRGCTELSKLPTSFEKLINLRHFDNVDTEELKDLPLGMGKLTALQTLSKICLGGSNHIGIRELKNLSHLRGSLSIMGLQNLTDVEDATESNLSKKQGLDRLVMEWIGDIDSRNQRLEKEVLDFLQPHTNLKRLEIRFYSGAEFPNWFGDASLANVVHLELVGCSNCTSLPLLGQLSSLKYLRIQGMPRVKSINVEIFGAESLIVEDMLELEEWSSFTHVEEIFPALCKLWIFNCPKLMKVSLSKLPSLCELKLRKCGEMVMTRIVSLASLITLEIWDISGLCQVDEGIIKFLGALEDLNIQNCGELKSLWKGEIAQQYLVSLRSLHIQECPNLVCLTEEDRTLPNNLKSISIENCDKLEKLPSDLPPMLKSLEITNCGVLDVQNNSGLEDSKCDSVEDKINCGASHSQLERLSISSCQSLTSFPTGDLPSTLKGLGVWNCTKLKAGVEEMLQSTMSSLESLFIYDWVNLKSPPLSFLNFLHLTGLEILRCPGLEYFPGNGLPPSLRRLWIMDCMKLRSLPDHMQSLKSLQHLKICTCPSLQSTPKGGLPPNLKIMYIWDLKLPLSQWGLRSLTSLDCFSAEFHDLVSFPDEHLLPASLTRLDISKSSTLETISTGVEKLTSLKVLSVEDCPKLQSLPESLLRRLSKLEVTDCPLLKPRCLKEKGDYWPSIAYIPCVEID